mgnify:FL=1
MAFATLKLKNENGAIKEAPVGFSWTTFCVGVFVPLTRGDWKWALIMMVVSFITFGLAGILFAFIYNRLYIDHLLKEGYRVISYWGDKREIERAAQIKLTGISSKSISNNSASSTSRKIYKKKSDDLKDLEELYNDGTLTKVQFKKAKNKLS